VTVEEVEEEEVKRMEGGGRGWEASLSTSMCMGEEEKVVAVGEGLGEEEEEKAKEEDEGKEKGEEADRRAALAAPASFSAARFLFIAQQGGTPSRSASFLCFSHRCCRRLSLPVPFLYS
jgi:hypothetical protein